LNAATTDAGAHAPAPECLASLLRQSAAGDQDAFAGVYDATASRVFGLALRLVRDRAQAEEVAQEVYLQIWIKSGTFDASRGAALSWIVMQAHSAAVGRIRAEQSRSNREMRYERQHGADRRSAINPTHDLVAATLNAERVREAVRRLSPVQRGAVELAFFDGYTYPQVAELLEIPLGTAKARIRGGLVKLRQLLDEEITA
jgi:RNA polymerase sigma-70 factor (ECF subfamily)